MSGPSKNIKVLTTNRHEIYLSLLSDISAGIDVLTRVGKTSLPWREQYGALPSGLKLVEWDSELEDRIRSDFYDFVILHTIEDLIAFRRFKNVRFIFVIHLALYTHTLLFKVRALIKKILLREFLARHKCQVVAVSPWKLSTWGALPNPKVVLLASTEVITAEHLTGEVSLITVGNHFYTRPELNFELLCFIREKVPVTVCGLNPGIDDAILPRSRKELLTLIAKHQVYLYTTESPWNDGYNTSVLEAMRAGLAVVSMAHPTSPIDHGKGGFLAHSREELLEFIIKLKSDPKLCRDFGEYNKKIIETKFSNQAFISAWQLLLKDLSAHPY